MAVSIYCAIAFHYTDISIEIAMVILRNFCGDPQLLTSINELIQETMSYRRNARVCHFD